MIKHENKNAEDWSQPSCVCATGPCITPAQFAVVVLVFEVPRFDAVVKLRPQNAAAEIENNRVSDREQQNFTGGARRAACCSFKHSHAAHICNDIGLIVFHSHFERSVAKSTAEQVSRSRKHAIFDGTHKSPDLAFAVTSALDSTSS
jgi:hypothetical protein